MNKQSTRIKATLANSKSAIEPVELVRLALSGCADAFHDLVMRYTPRLLVLLTHRHRGNRADAEDVVQEALLRAFQCLDRYDSRSDFRVWLFTIAYRISTDHLRKHQRQSRLVLEHAASTVQLYDEPKEIDQRESVQSIWDTAKQVLSDYYFSVLWLSVGEELTNKEIAKVLGRNALSIRVAVHRAKKKLMSCLPVANQHQLTNTVSSIDVGVETT